VAPESASGEALNADFSASAKRKSLNLFGLIATFPSTKTGRLKFQASA